MTGRTLSRLHIAAVLIAFALLGCGDDEATHRKAFIEFLQSRIVAKPGIHVPKLTTEETTAFGDYAKHYAVIADFNAGLNRAVSRPMQDALKSGTPHSLGEVMARRQDIAAVAEGMAKIRAALDQQLATADAAHAALKQPGDLKPVYDAAYDRDVAQPAKAFAEFFPEVDEAMKSILALADFVAAHHETVKIQGTMIQTSDPSLQPSGGDDRQGPGQKRRDPEGAGAAAQSCLRDLTQILRRRCPGLAAARVCERRTRTAAP